MNAAAVLSLTAAAFALLAAQPAFGSAPMDLSQDAPRAAVNADEHPVSTAPTADPNQKSSSGPAPDSETPRLHKAAFPACPPLPPLIPGKRPFPTGEKLTYDLDIMGAHAARMTLGTKAARSRGGTQVLPIALQAQTGTLFSKIRSLKADIRCELDQPSLLPTELLEDVIANGRRYRHEVTFSSAAEGHSGIGIAWLAGEEKRGRDDWELPGQALDYLSAFYFFRALQLKPGGAFCADILVLRHLWRVEGTVAGREHASTPAGEFDVLHLTAKAVRHDKPEDIREVHYWVSDDAYRLPVAAMGVIDLGTLRAVLTSVHRQDLTLEAASSAGQKW